MTTVVEAFELPKTHNQLAATLLDEAYRINEDFDSVVRTREGDVQAFGQLYARYAHPITSRLIDLCNGDTYLAEDLAQDTFVKALTKIDSLKDVSNGAGPWLFTIARNTFYDSLRLKKYRQDTSETPNDNAIRIARDQDEESVIDGLIAKAELQQIFKELPVSFSDCLAAVAEGYSGKEIAALLGIKKATVRTRTMRGRERAKRIHQNYKFI